MREFGNLPGITPQEFWANDYDPEYGKRMAESIERYVVMEMSPDLILDRFREIGCDVSEERHGPGSLAIVYHPELEEDGVCIDIRGPLALVRVDNATNFERFLVLMERCATSPMRQGASE